MATRVEDIDQFESMLVDERRRVSGAFKTLPSRTGRFPDGVLLTATKSNFGVFECAPRKEVSTGLPLRTYVIARETLAEVLPRLEALVKTTPEDTARALVEATGGTSDVASVTTVLTSGKWPELDDAAQEAAGFAHYLFKYARIAAGQGLGVCWEYRGEFPLGDQEIAEGPSS